MVHAQSLIDSRWLRRIAAFLLPLAVLAVIAAPAEARRVALVIGNSTYSHANLLPNAGRDASLVAEAARQAGFETIVLSDLTKANLDSALRSFRRQADGAEVAMIYYAGHGMESGGKNWVIPVDAVLPDPLELRFEAIDLDGLLETVSGAGLRMVVLDACRNNPFGRSWRSSVRTVPAGLAETELQGSGSLVIFAAAGGQVATDGTGDNSPFARALAHNLTQPGLSIHRLGPTIREEVINETGGRQSPWVSMTLEGKEFFLVPSPSAVTAQGGGEGLAMADSFAWRYADARNTVAAYQEYVGKFPDGVFASDARERIARLQSAAPAAVAVRNDPAPAAKAVTPLPEAGKPLSSQPGPALPGIVASAEPQSMAAISINANTTTDRASLPRIPATPRFPADGYPDCRENHVAIVDPIARVVKINECLSALTRYVTDVMNGYSATMIRHQEELTRLYNEDVADKPVYSPQSQQRFFNEAMAEFRESNPGGSHFAEYRATKQRVERDRAYLEAQYCIHARTC